jgi:hypothetical protein
MGVVQLGKLAAFTEKGPESPCFQAGDEWPIYVAGFVPVRQNRAL